MYISEIAVHIRIAAPQKVEFLKGKDVDVIQVCTGCEKTLNSAGQAAKIGKNTKTVTPFDQLFARMKASQESIDDKMPRFRNLVAMLL